MRRSFSYFYVFTCYTLEGSYPGLFWRNLSKCGRGCSTDLVGLKDIKDITPSVRCLISLQNNSISKLSSFITAVKGERKRKCRCWLQPWQPFDLNCPKWCIESSVSLPTVCLPDTQTWQLQQRLIRLQTCSGLLVFQSCRSRKALKELVYHWNLPLPQPVFLLCCILLAVTLVFITLTFFFSFI